MELLKSGIESYNIIYGSYPSGDLVTELSRMEGYVCPAGAGRYDYSGGPEGYTLSARIKKRKTVFLSTDDSRSSILISAD